MAKRRFSESTWRSDPWFQSLCKALLGCTNQREISDFLRDIGTLAELQAWSERFEVARQLKKGSTYRTISSITGASTTTVTRVAGFLQNGEGGYRNVLGNHRHASSPRGERMASNA